MKENEILAYLTKLSPGDIYTISPKQYFLRGFEYYKTGRLKGLSWSDGCKALNASVKGSEIYSVSLFMNKGVLRCRCDCPAWTHHTNCKHVVCAILTVKNLLDPACFNVNRPSGIYRDTLTESLRLGAAPAKEAAIDDKGSPLCSILLEKNIYTNNLDFSVRIAGAAPDQPHLQYHYALSRELQRLASASNAFAADKDQLLLAYLNKHGNTHPLFIKTDGRENAVEWTPSLVFSAKTGLNASRDTISIRKLCVSKSGVCKKPLILGHSIIADIAGRKLGRLEDRRGWGAWENIVSAVNRVAHCRQASYMPGQDMDERLKIPIDLFNDIQFSLEGWDADAHRLTFSVGANAAAPCAAENEYCMTIDAHDTMERCMVIKARVGTGGLRGATTGLFFDLLPSIIYGNRISGSTAPQTRRAAAVNAFIKFLSIKKRADAAAVVKDALSIPEFITAQRKETSRRLAQAWNLLQTKSTRLVFHNGKWYLSENELEKEAPLYTIPFEVFGLPLFDGLIRHNEFIVPAERLRERLSELHSRLAERGIPLFYKGKPVKGSKWDFSINCTNGAIDWFEIRPEIRCAGAAVDEAAWHKAAENNGVVEDNEFVSILDSNSRSVLDALSVLNNGQRASKKKDSEIVTIPRMRMLDLFYLRKKGVELILSDDDEALLERLDNFDKIEKRALPGALNARLRPYQRDGYYWLSFLYEQRFGACLADDMGLGKTLQAIALLAGIKEGKVRQTGEPHGPHLLVLPPSLLFNWQNELSRFYPDFKIHFYAGKERTTAFEDSDVVLTTYGLVRRDIEKLREMRFNVIIFDEAQAVKNIYADTTGAARQLKGNFKLTLTGTPVENHIGEYYSILDLSLPGLLGEYDDFKSGMKADTTASLDTVLRRAKPFVLRRTKEAVLKDLPPKTESDIYLDLTDRQKALYKKTVAAVRSTISKAYEDKTEAQARLIALTAILRLRQLCVSPALIDTGFSEPSPKIEFLIGSLKELVEEGHSALVFSQFTSFLDILEHDLKKNDLSFCRLDGSTPIKKRKGLVEGFQNGAAPIFLLSLKAGGQGLNLTKASYVFHLDPWWNPAVENQASDRAHRIGQLSKVTITRILMRHTVEEKMMELKKKKLALYEAVMGNCADDKRGAAISRSDFDYLLDG